MALPQSPISNLQPLPIDTPPPSRYPTISRSPIYKQATHGTINTMTENSEQLNDLIPLREPTFFILLSLADGEKHGYAILKDVEAVSGGKVTLSTGTLYEALARLLDQGLIERVETDEEQNHPGRPRKMYRLTSTGLRVMQAETARLQALITAARRRLGAQPLL